MVALDPQALWSVSFQLSFAAMAGIAVLAEPIGLGLRRLLGGSPDDGTYGASLLGFISMATAMTIAATIATLPLVAFYFHQISLVGLPATVLGLPVLPMVLVTHVVAGLVGLAAPAVAVPLGWLAWLATAYLTAVVDLFARVPGASIETGRLAPLLAWAYYGILFLWLAARPLRSGATAALSRLRTSPPTTLFSDGTVPWWVLLPALSIAALVWIAALSVPDGRLHVTFADVGQGDATFITTPSGRHILVDGGPDTLEATRLVGSRLPFWRRSVDLVVLTHPHADHVRGLAEVLGRYHVAGIMERRFQYDSPAYDAWKRAVENEGAGVIQAHSGQLVAIDDGVFIQVLGPPETLLRGTGSDIDNASVVLRLVYGEVSFLLTGDMFAEEEAWLVQRGAPVDSDVLKVAHHGSRTSSSETFLAAVTPAIAVISAGEDNRHGHPHPETVEALLRYVTEDRVLSTAERGTIEFVTDGARLEVKTER
jgi:competence protein ComEC